MSSPAVTKKGNDERSESGGRDEAGPSTSGPKSPNKKKSRRRWRKRNNKPLKSHKPKPSTSTPMAGTSTSDIDSDDPIEGFCAVCFDDRDEALVCCHVCPEVFHPNCHLPAMTGVPKKNWQCMFCKPLEALPAHTFTLTPGKGKKLGLTKLELEVPSNLPRGRFLYACKFLSELYKGKDYVRLMVHYYSHLMGKMKDPPINLNYFRERLTFGKPEPFQNTEDMIPLLRKMIAGARKLYKTSPIELQHVAAIDRKFNANILIYFPKVSRQVPRRLANADEGEESDSDSETELRLIVSPSTESFEDAMKLSIKMRELRLNKLRRQFGVKEIE